MKFFLCIALILATYTLAAQKGQDINHTDSLGNKQGKWIVYGKDLKYSSYCKPSQIVEEGHYENNHKTGLWKEYYCSGAIKNQLMFVNGKVDGPAVMYHENGRKSEEGTWKNNRWIGHYIQYNDKGDTLLQLNFLPDGKRYGPSTHCDFDVVGKVDTINGYRTFYNAHKQITKEGKFVNGKLHEGKAYFYNEHRILERIAIYKDGKYVGDIPKDPEK
ncbi:MAG: hypothetical protein JST26_17835 [Bacteroidetes bacterium]|nr:hypothetical protein [Bacteroidota bacterium]